MLGSFLFVTVPEPNIMQVVGYVARFQATPKQTHVSAVKRIFKYLKEIVDYGLWFPTYSDFSLTTYIHVDWGGSVDDKKSTSGCEYFLGGCLVSWLSKKQTCTSLSIVEVEYIAAVSCSTQVIWIKIPR